MSYFCPELHYRSFTPFGCVSPDPGATRAGRQTFP
jgi:hypothetical protein